MLLLSEYLVEAADALPVEKCYSLLRGEDLMQVHSNAINLVVGRDLRRNVAYSATMALELAASGKRVMYLNTYAGDALLRRAFVAAAVSSGEQSGGGSAEPEVDRICVESVPSGNWSYNVLRQRLEASKCEVLILNSFEFAELSRYHREKVARDLYKLQQSMGLTVVVFSHEMKRDLEAGCTARGAIGIIAALAQSVSKVGDEWRQTKVGWSAPKEGIGEKDIKRADVHEKQTLNKSRLPKKFGGQSPNPSIDIEGDRGFSYHYGDFWSDPFHRGPMVSYLGKDMSLFARTPLLQSYLQEHGDTVFMSGNTPTEEELRGMVG